MIAWLKKFLGITKPEAPKYLAKPKTPTPTKKKSPAPKKKVSRKK